jgi:hypothetical protein
MQKWKYILYATIHKQMCKKQDVIIIIIIIIIVIIIIAQAIRKYY